MSEIYNFFDVIGMPAETVRADRELMMLMVEYKILEHDAGRIGRKFETTFEYAIIKEKILNHIDENYE